MRAFSPSLALCLALAACEPKDAPVQSPMPVPVAAPEVVAVVAVDTTTPASADEVLVQVSFPEGFTGVEIACPGGYRERAALATDATVTLGSARMKGVPAEACTLYFKGGSPARYAPVQGGQSLRCDLIETTAVCRAFQPGESQSGGDLPTVKQRPERDQVIVYLDSNSGVTAVDVSCPGGYRRWSAIAGSRAVLDGVPRGEECLLDFKGRTTTRYRPVHGEMTLTCKVGSAGAACVIEQFRTVPVATPDRTLPPPPAGVLEFVVDPHAGFRAVEVTCPGGYRARADVRGNKARFTGMPAGDCIAQFKGPVAGRYEPVRGGQRLNCAMIGSTAICSGER